MGSIKEVLTPVSTQYMKQNHDDQTDISTDKCDGERIFKEVLRLFNFSFNFLYNTVKTVPFFYFNTS